MATVEQHVEHRAAWQPRGVVTPEAVRLEFDTAGVFPRMVGRFIDLWVAGAVFLGVLTLVSGLGPAALEPGLILAVFLALFGYPAAAEAVWGTTAGKSMLDLRVITVEGAPVQFRHAAIRSALQVVDLFLVPIGVVAIVSSLAGPDDQRLGDRLAGTLVVRTSAFGVRSRAVAFPPLPGYERFVAGLDVSGIRPRHYEVLRSFLTRVDELTPESRHRIGMRLTAPTATALGLPEAPPMHHEAFLVSVVAAYQQRHLGPATWMFGPTGVPAPRGVA